MPFSKPVKSDHNSNFWYVQNNHIYLWGMGAKKYFRSPIQSWPAKNGFSPDPIRFSPDPCSYWIRYGYSKNLSGMDQELKNQYPLISAAQLYILHNLSIFQSQLHQKASWSCATLTLCHGRLWCRDEHGSGLDQHWSQFGPDQDWIGLEFFWKLTDQDWTEKFLLF